MKKITLNLVAIFISIAAIGQSFFVPTTYRGAFAPSPTAMWTDTWTNWDPQNTVYPTSNVTITTSITTNTLTLDSFIQFADGTTLSSALISNSFTEGITAPTSPIAGDRWFKADEGILYTAITGVSGSIWVEL